MSIALTNGLFAEGQIIYLKDSYKEIIHDLSETPYNFTSEAGQFDERFQIVYELEEILAVDDASLGGIQIYQNNQSIIISSKTNPILSVEIFDLVGRNMYKNAKVKSN